MKINTKNGKLLPLIDDFYTLQGEGEHTGRAAYFIRLGGCDIGCNFCDTKISWNVEHHQLIDIDVIVSRAKTFPAQSIVVTGGEPLTYNLNILCEKLKSENIKTYLETSGCYNLSGTWDWICVSPKKQQPPQNEVISKADELKVIIENKTDFKWAEENAKLTKNNCKLFLQPEWSVHKTITKEIVEYVKTNCKWKISIQAHKFMKIP